MCIVRNIAKHIATKCTKKRFYILVLSFILCSHSVYSSPGNTNDLAAPNQEFAVDLFHELSQSTGNENLFFSPYGLSTALMMMYVGTNDHSDSHTQLQKLLHLENINKHSLPRSVLQELNRVHRLSDNNDVILDVANAIYLPANNLVKESYQDEVSTYFKGKILKNASLEIINEWFSNTTHGKITDFVKRLDADFMLLNAIYFKGKWALPFNPALTDEGIFYLENSEPKTVPFMRHLDQYRVSTGVLDNSFDVINIPYDAHGSLVMTILLPSQTHNIRSLNNKLTATNIRHVFNTVDNEPVRKFELVLPRFSLSSEFNLINTLIRLGVTAPWPGGYDFSKISDQELALTAVNHKAVIDVNEKGSEAAATTNLVFLTRSFSSTFHVDHPFIFFIRERSGNIFFMGQVINPSDSEEDNSDISLKYLNDDPADVMIGYEEDSMSHDISYDIQGKSVDVGLDEPAKKYASPMIKMSERIPPPIPEPVTTSSESSSEPMMESTSQASQHRKHRRTDTRNSLSSVDIATQMASTIKSTMAEPGETPTPRTGYNPETTEMNNSGSSHTTSILFTLLMSLMAALL